MEFLAERFRPTQLEAAGELSDRYVFIDGRFVKGRDASILVWDRGLLYGDGVFEGIRVYSGRIFKLREHIDRLYDSAKAIGMENIPLTKDEMCEAVVRTVRINELRDAHVRVVVTRGVGRLGLDPRGAVRPTVIIMAYPYPPLLGEKPARLITSSIRKKSPHSIDAKIKSLNYLENILAKLQAVAAGMDDAIIMDMAGAIAEGTGENIFVVKDGVISTPRTIACLHGVTRATVMELAERMGLKVVERDITVQELYTADEIFLAGTAAGIHPVAEVDGRRIGREVPGPITRRIREAYERCVVEEHVIDVYG